MYCYICQTVEEGSRQSTSTCEDVTVLLLLYNMCTMTHCTISPKKCSMCVIQSTFHSTIIYTCVYTTVLEYVCHG